MLLIISRSILDEARNRNVDEAKKMLHETLKVRASFKPEEIRWNHYPERLTFAFPYNPPRIFEALWICSKVFPGPKTFQKVKFVYPAEVMKSLFDIDNFPSEFGGKATLNVLGVL
ncbi:hypothetical protein K2173_021292 [Erythroxylum novogranatense]|uniref:CRAL-TRIO domain-containing protein n=1 Tax=Erythroxylum novogranatense TaxID=1862640 RepID=A0AAV8TWU5_9ROSI|nr:hypothetical protein K2173_021292 [Erythroxylum novogranatense]